jgi:hypothetical protein
MQNRHIFNIFLCVIVSVIPQIILSQTTNSISKKDSLKVYKKIKKAAYKYRLTRMAYDAVFVNPEPQEYPIEPATRKTKNVNPYIKYEKKTIRNIDVRVYDPFGNSVTDTIPKKINGIQRVGNKTHFKTQKWIIINRLLFKENDTLNPLALSESERILRGAIFISDAKIFITSTKNKDSVDINVVVVDRYSINIPVFVSDVSANVRFQNRNLLGLGQQFEQYVGFRRPNILEYNGSYNIANIDNTFITAQAGYQTSLLSTGTYLLFDRPFYSPLTSYAWGLNVYYNWTYFNYKSAIDSSDLKERMQSFGYDAYYGRTIKLSDSKTIFNQSTNIILSARHFQNRFTVRPNQIIDPDKTMFHTYATLGNVGFAVQQYYKDKFIYRFGANEDVPEGLIVQFTYGGLKKEFQRIRYYSGFEIARAKHFKNFGYISATFSSGIFFNKSVNNDLTTNFKLYYFSDLKRRGRWLFRQFFNYDYVYGLNKWANETITLSSGELYGFENQLLIGNTKMIFNSETVAYAPYNIIGFRIAPIFLAGFGIIGDKQNKLVKSNLYQGYSVGVMVRNENLLSSTFQISVGFYPFLPDGRNYVFKYNPVTSFTLRVRAFSVNRPEFVGY